MTLSATILVNRIQQALDDGGVGMTPYEVQATLVGFVAGGITIDDQSWIKPFSELCNDGQKLPQALHEVSRDLFRTVVNQLQDDDFVFSPLLNDDEEAELALRLEALSEWAQAYLIALAMVRTDLKQAPKDIREMIEDVAAIAQVGVDDSEHEDAERAYVELVEYLSVVVMSCFVHFSLSSDTDEPKNTLH
jgi:uncharacterized protein